MADPALPALVVKFYKNVFQIICSVILVIIPVNILEALRHKSEISDYCLLYHLQFKLYQSKSFLVLNAPMSHRRIHNFLSHISSSLILHREANRAKSASLKKKSLTVPQTPYPYRTSLRSVRPDRPWPSGFSVAELRPEKVRPGRQSRPHAFASPIPPLEVSLNTNFSPGFF